MQAPSSPVNGKDTVIYRRIPVIGSPMRWTFGFNNVVWIWCLPGLGAIWGPETIILIGLKHWGPFYRCQNRICESPCLQLGFPMFRAQNKSNWDHKVSWNHLHFIYRMFTDEKASKSLQEMASNSCWVTRTISCFCAKYWDNFAKFLFLFNFNF